MNFFFVFNEKYDKEKEERLPLCDISYNKIIKKLDRATKIKIKSLVCIHTRLAI